MAYDKLVDSTALDADLTTVANAIRTKGGTSAQLHFPDEYVSAINAIETGGGGTDFIITLSKDQNDVWTPDKTFAEIQTAYSAGKDIVTTTSSYYAVYGTYDEIMHKYYYSITLLNYDEFGDAPYYVVLDYSMDNNGITLENDSDKLIHPYGSISITSNGTHDVTNYASTSVNVQPSLETTTVTPTESQQTITPSTGKDGFSQVTVNAIPSNYIIPTGNLAITANGTGIDVSSYATASVDVPSGGAKHTATITGSGAYGMQYVTYNEINYSSSGSFEFEAGDNLYIYTSAGRLDISSITIDSVVVASGSSGSSSTYNWELPDVDINISLDGTNAGTIHITTPSLTITENGTYNVIGYATALVNVSGSGGGASNFVTGTFTGTTKGEIVNIDIPYSGNGYPIMIFVIPTRGMYGNRDYYNLIQRYAIGYLAAYKTYASSTPTYNTKGTGDQFSTCAAYKNNGTSATSYTRAFSPNAVITYGNSADPGGATQSLLFRNSKKFSVLIANTSFGFAANIEYTYYIMYSE